MTWKPLLRRCAAGDSIGPGPASATGHLFGRGGCKIAPSFPRGLHDTPGGAGVAIPNGDRADSYCDGTDFYNAAPTIIPAALTVAGGATLAGALAMAGKVSGMAAGTANTDGVNVTQLAAAIAASVPAGTAGTFLNNIADTTRGFAPDKITTSGLLLASTVNADGS